MEKIKITAEVIGKIFFYADNTNLEISGFGRFNDTTKMIDNLLPILNQECSATETEVSEKALEELALTKGNKDIRLQWHSHVDMGVFWSGQDEECIESLGKFIPFLISIVVNKRHDYKCRIDIFYPLHYRIDDVTLDVHFPLQQNLIESMKREIKEKVKQYKPNIGKWINEEEFGFAGEKYQYFNQNLLQTKETPSIHQPTKKISKKLQSLGYFWNEKTQLLEKKEI